MVNFFYFENASVVFAFEVALTLMEPIAFNAPFVGPFQLVVLCSLRGASVVLADVVSAAPFEQVAGLR